MSESTPFEHSTESREQPIEYLYHGVPKNMVGNTLRPLNELKEEYPEVFQAEVQKYEGREDVMEQRIPELEVLWNDVIHISPVHPREIKEVFLEAGHKPPETEWYQIPISAIDPTKAIVYRNQLPELENEDFESYNLDKLKAYSELPEETKQYYKEELAAGRRPLLFYKIPHILYRGSIPLSECEKIKI